MRRNYNAKEHVKLYKSKKNWVAATVFTTALGITGVSAVSNASANSVSSSSASTSSTSSSKVASSSVKPSNTVTLRSSSAANSSSTTTKSSSAQSSSVASQKASLQNQINQKKQDLSNEQSQQSSLQNQYQKGSQAAQQNQSDVNSIKNSETQTESKISSLSNQKSDIQNQINNLSNNLNVANAQQTVNDAQSKLDKANKAVQQAQNKLDADKKEQGQLGTPWISENNGNAGVVGVATKAQEEEWDNGVYIDANAQSILDQLNLQRIAHGVAPVKLDPYLEKTAQWRVSPNNSDSLMKSFKHTDECANTAFAHGYMSCGENIAQGDSPEQVVNSWNNEPAHVSDHRTNDFDPRFTNVGVAFNDGYAVIDFAGLSNNVPGYNGLDDDQIWTGTNSVKPVSMINNSQKIQQDQSELSNAINSQKKAQNALASAQSKLNKVRENNNNQIKKLKNTLDGVNKQLDSALAELKNEKKAYSDVQNPKLIDKLNKDKAALDKLNNQIAQTKQEINNLENQLNALNGQPTTHTQPAAKPSTNTSTDNKTDDVLPGPDQIVVTPTETEVSNKTAANLDYNHGIDPLTGKALKDETPAQQQKAKAYVDALNKDTNNATASSKQNTPAKNTENPVASKPVTTTSVANKVVANIAYNKGIDPLTNRLLSDETPAQQRKVKNYIENLNKPVAVKENKSSEPVYNQPITFTFSENKVKADNVSKKSKNTLPTTGESQDKGEIALGIEAASLGLALGGLSFLKRKKNN